MSSNNESSDGENINGIDAKEVKKHCLQAWF